MNSYYVEHERTNQVKAIYPSKAISSRKIITPFFQPIDNLNKKTLGFEVLARKFSHGFYNNINFSKLNAEKILAIDIEILNKVFNQMSAIRTHNYEFISINLTPVKPSNYYCNKLFSTVKEAANNGINIWIEIAEHTQVQKRHMELIEQLKQYDNVKIALDDFGSKESHFQRIFNIDFDIIKLDRQILLSAAENEHSSQVFNSLVNYFQEMGKMVLCEGIETVDQLNIVKSATVDFIQGFFLGKPSPYY
ncbi:EAL domain-containing protein [Vibrio salilacus]|uniref:EAL domain-containing protein n=1 Tax=Vibrio salilacus TaxID=1323749 RepID=UPI000C2A746A|nr:EAL domain-containing protein [Vibrio salilacus]